MFAFGLDLLDQDWNFDSFEWWPEVYDRFFHLDAYSSMGLLGIVKTDQFFLNVKVLSMSVELGCNLYL